MPCCSVQIKNMHEGHLDTIGLLFGCPDFDGHMVGPATGIFRRFARMSSEPFTEYARLSDGSLMDLDCLLVWARSKILAAGQFLNSRC